VIGSSRPQLRAEYLGARAKQAGSCVPLVRFTCLSGVMGCNYGECDYCVRMALRGV
jgi:hypothetical protein